MRTMSDVEDWVLTKLVGDAVACPNPMPPDDQAFWAATLAAAQAQGQVEPHVQLLTRLRDAAGKWRDTIGALAGVSLIATVLAQRDQLLALARGWEIIAYLLLLGSLVTVALAIVVASRAAVGPLRLGTDDPLAICRHYRREPVMVRLSLAAAQGLTLASVGFLVAAILVINHGPCGAPAPASYVALPAGGVAVCGRLATGASGQLGLVSGSTGTPYPLRNVVALTSVAACP